VLTNRKEQNKFILISVNSNGKNNSLLQPWRYFAKT
jgi:hypothetical protein